MISATHTSNTCTPTRRVRLLVADDSLIARQSILAYLGTLSHVEVQTVCENGRLAVEAALRQEPDVVLLDLQMPVMSGLEAAEIFRNSMPHVGVIMTSAHDNHEVRAACRDGGADAFVGKAAINTAFVAALDDVIALRSAPERHRRAPHVARRPIVDLFAAPLPSWHSAASTPAGRPGRGSSASGSPLG